MSYIRRNIDWSDPIAVRAYHRKWVKTNYGKDYQRRKIERKRKLDASTKAARDAMKSHARVAASKSYMRYAPIASWGYCGYRHNGRPTMGYHT